MLGRDVDRELQTATKMGRRQGARDRRAGWRPRHARPRQVEGCGGARPGQLVIDLLFHRGDLASHRRGKLWGPVGGEPIDLVRQDAQRSLQAMREITGLDAATGHDLLVALKKRVEILDQRLGLGWELAIEPLYPSFSDRRHA